MGVSKNRGTPKSSILTGFSITNHPFLGTPIFGNIHIVIGDSTFCPWVSPVIWGHHTIFLGTPVEEKKAVAIWWFVALVSGSHGRISLKKVEAGNSIGKNSLPNGPNFYLLSLVKYWSKFTSHRFQQKIIGWLEMVTKQENSKKLISGRLFGISTKSTWHFAFTKIRLRFLLREKVVSLGLFNPL